MSLFRADCSRCCGLCCVVPTHFAFQGFGVDKPADRACVHLKSGHHCSIHERREELGYEACRGFDCFGAGQWVTQQLFGGANWTLTDQPSERMFAAYRHWAPRFAAAALIEAALAHVREDARAPLIAKMTELTTSGTSDEALFTDPVSLRRNTLALIRSMLKAVGDTVRPVEIPLP
jgi:hypothetical protein